MRKAFVEGAATWRQWTAQKTWEIAGAKGTTDRGSVVLGDVVASASGTQRFALNSSGVAQVQNWVNGTQPNAGLIIANETNTDGFTVNMKEAASGRPVLRVTYH